MAVCSMNILQFSFLLMVRIKPVKDILRQNLIKEDMLKTIKVTLH